MNRPLALALAGALALAAAAVRHVWFWGGSLAWLANLGEGLALVLFAVLGGLGCLRAATLPTAAVWTGGIVLTLIATATPPFLSNDVFDYVLHGRVESVHGANPYVYAPRAFADDPFFAYCQWPDWVTPYGPIWVALQTVLTGLGEASVWASVYLLKLSMAGCHLLTAWLLARVARAQLALWLWNPFLLLEVAGSAHNEALLALFLMLMAVALAQDRIALATLAFGCAVLTKHGCAPLGPLLLAWCIRQRRLAGFAAGLVATGVLTFLCALHYFREPAALAFLGRQLGNRGASVQGVLVHWLGDAAAAPVAWLGQALAGVVTLCCAWRVRDLQGLARHGALVSLTFLLVAMPLFSPWYHLWWLPLVALAPGRMGSALRWLCVLGPLSYLAYASRRSLGLDHQILQWSLGLVVPLVVVCRTACASERVSN